MTETTEIFSNLQEMIKGCSLLKVGRNGKAHFRQFSLSNDLSCIRWSSPRKDMQDTIILVSQMTTLVLGQKTKVFLGKPMPDLEPLSFSLLYTDSQGLDRSLDIVCQTQSEFNTWTIGLRALTDGIEEKAATIELLQSIEIEADSDINLKKNKDMAHPDAIVVGMNLMQNDQVFYLYTWGSGTNGTLGHGDDVDKCSPRVVEALLSCNIRNIACGKNVTMTLTADGKVYTWGSGKYGLLGHGNLRSKFTPLKVVGLRSFNITAISCHELHAAAVTESGELYTWGKGSEKFDRLGYACESKQNSPLKVTALSSYAIRSVACGYEHTLAVTDVGIIFSFGDNSEGQLGVGDYERHSDPVLVTDLQHEAIIKVACGKFHSCAISAKGSVWMWGFGRSGQLGYGNYDSSNKPLLLKAGEGKPRIIDVSCGDYHTCILSINGSVYCFGDNGFGQIGAHTFRKICQPYRVVFNINRKILMVSCGSFHSAAVAENGKLYTWGFGADGRLGLGDCKSRFSPTEVEVLNDKKIGMIACGCTHMATLAVQSISTDKKPKSTWLAI